MKSRIKYCSSCAITGRDSVICDEKNSKFSRGYIFGFGEDIENCPFCNTPLVDVPITVEDFETIRAASDYNRELLEEMIELKKENPEEYEIRITQARFVAEKNKQADQERKKYEITCPRCGSTNTSTDVRRVGVFEILFGASGYYRVCNTCGYRWKPGSLSESIDRIHYGHK